MACASPPGSHQSTSQNRRPSTSAQQTHERERRLIDFEKDAIESHDANKTELRIENLPQAVALALHRGLHQGFFGRFFLCDGLAFFAFTCIALLFEQCQTPGQRQGLKKDDQKQTQDFDAMAPLEEKPSRGSLPHLARFWPPGKMATACGEPVSGWRGG